MPSGIKVRGTRIERDICDMARAGRTVESICDSLGLVNSTVYRTLKRNNVKMIKDRKDCLSLTSLQESVRAGAITERTVIYHNHKPVYVIEPYREDDHAD